MTALLTIEGLGKNFGGLAAVRDLGFTLNEGEIVGLIGPNGAGKSTAFNMISGALAPSAGRIVFSGEDITGRRPSQVVRHGLARTFQSATVYPKATVKENIYRGALCHFDVPVWAQIAQTAAYREARRQVREQVDKVLEMTGLAPYRDEVAGALAYGHQKRIGVAIGLATRPRLLLLDEPAAGLNPEECAEFGRLLKALRDEHRISLLFVEHHMALVMGTCDKIIVLVHGQKIAQGTAEEIRNSPAVIEAYLGVDEDAHA
ncbi:ABC transporter ATP-binding protein [Acidovorax sp. NCPPB 3859]|nr:MULTISPECIES: ABC transporter ATP-binding protein [unclassified Acidovorax]MDA8449043.1 ABC transporter ATP-binding protein [Acidovorax sp. GBBC 3297]MDA8458869.1 ABC transporter ATP-binding protein [Acidovorax sp. GBBC 3333]MDA8463799.1 ABC transporter ATP-binding protein [Acidovorax sp. GBBC 3332]MDA8468831.1 ABC transporter ATP-binding protein [Acidovorax sp. GBBC 3299]WCM80441.1 ABC transporter ATP-binding protein [Acidovorax sp. GBBC 712]